MATVDWPTSRAFAPAGISLVLDVSEQSAVGAYTGNRTHRSNLADRMVLTLTLAPCLRADAYRREAFLLGVRSRRDWIRMGVPARETPAGTARGTMLAVGAHAAGVRTLSIDGISPSTGTLIGGDILSVGANTLLMVAYAGATASGGAASVPLVSPLPVALSDNAPVAWSTPKGIWELDEDGLQLDYSAPVVQAGVAIRLRQVISS
ncbi:MAG: hypothetical protein RLZZ524_808 [Pseudomonadota bacterium]|jgi:hypothetical protein